MPATGRSTTRPRAIAWVALTGMVLTYAGTALLYALTEPRTTADLVSMVGTASWIFAFAGVGVLITVQRPGNAIGRVCLAFGAIWVVYFLVETALDFESAHPGSIPNPALIAALAYPLWVPGVGLIAVLLLIFPGGHLPSRRWRPVAWGLGTAMAVLIVTGWFLPGAVQDHPDLINPLGIAALEPFDTGIPGMVLVMTLIGSLLAAAVSLVVRFRRARGVDRLQMKWLVAAGVLSALGYPILFIRDFEVQVLWASIPIAIGIAMQRHRLYDIDRLVSRAVVYTVVVGILALVYAGAVFLLSAISPLEGSIAVASSTLAAVALFNPVRRRVRTWVERRFNRERYDAARVASGLAEGLREPTDVTVIVQRWVDAVTATMHPSAVGVWVSGKPVGLEP